MRSKEDGQAPALLPSNNYYSWLGRVTPARVTTRWLSRGPPWQAPPKTLRCGLSGFQAHVECIMFLILTLPQLSSNKEFVRETIQIRNPTWAQQIRPSTSPVHRQHFSPLAWYCPLSILLADRIFHKAPSVWRELVLGLFIIVLFPCIKLVIFTAAFVIGKHSPSLAKRLWSSGLYFLERSPGPWISWSHWLTISESLPPLLELKQILKYAHSLPVPPAVPPNLWTWDKEDSFPRHISCTFSRGPRLGTYLSIFLHAANPKLHPSS